jgi:hypothetical protein
MTLGEAKQDAENRAITTGLDWYVIQLPKVGFEVVQKGWFDKRENKRKQWLYKADAQISFKP